MATETNPAPPDLKAILHEVERLSSSIEAAKRVGDVICALHSLAIRLFPLDSAALAGVLDEPHRAKVLNVSVPLDGLRMVWKHAFYKGPAFPAVARILIHDVGIDWLACFSRTARVQVYDQFFLNGPVSEIIQALVPCLALDGDCVEDDGSSVACSNVACSNVERLLVLCLLENRGIYKLTREFIEAFNGEKHAYGVSGADIFSLISRMARVLTSIPDKARLASPAVFSSHSFFKQVTDQLLDGAEERAAELFLRLEVLQVPITDGIFSFIGETFGRICRRGSTDALLATAIPRLLAHVRICMSQSFHSDISIGFQSNPKSVFWFCLIAHLKDSYAMEKLSQELLLKLASAEVNDEEAYWALWMLYHKIFLSRSTARLLFSEKFLLDKVYPFCCLRWILHLSVFECSPQSFAKVQNTRAFLATTKHLLDVWSKREFVQSAPLEKQAYITAAIGLCLERISKEELETASDMMNSVLRGVSCRLESPIDMVRKMASSIALMFSKVIDPSDPLYLDDTQTDTIDWEFGLVSSKKGMEGKSSIWHGRKTFAAESLPSGEITDSVDDNMIKQVDNKLNRNSKFSDAKAVDPDEVIDPASMNKDFHLEEYNSESDDSVISSDSSLQPYDMTDDDGDVKKKIAQISDLFAALRKSDDPDGVVQALNIAEKLIRVSPDELKHSAGDLVKTFVYIRCSDLAVEGEEESTEEKRQKALVALLVMCPFESVHVMMELLYSSTLDLSQRILIIDVMTEAVQELSCAKTLRTRHQQANLISSISDCKPWYLPGNSGPEGSGPWENVSERESLLSLTLCFERTLPSRPGQVKLGKSRRWSLPAVETQDNQLEWSQNRFPLYAAAFMLPAMQGFDKKRHGVDFLGRDFVILGKLIHMLGICMRCVAMHPEASALAPPLMDMLRSVSLHPEAYVRRAVLFAASCILVALHPSFIASALMEEHQHISKGLDWIRTWALHVSEMDSDTECMTMATTCLQLHAEMALQTSRSLESAPCFRSLTSIKSPTVAKDIILPISSIK